MQPFINAIERIISSASEPEPQAGLGGEPVELAKTLMQKPFDNGRWFATAHPLLMASWS
ncbi:hypothetical protein RR42_s2928 [Cupriavidus basilensis]|uniref:Uncharacterized protein n=1 Tax=Cupriavidus basilensis TaxID=68895 RepID=A0A0C4YR91_9BURK|nr:hypothetical protein RR42_s2928 [Cupriavidus basilensis]